MVNSAVTPLSRELADERALILSYSRAPTRGGLAAMLALDDRLGGILRTTRDPIVGQMRLTWWHDALSRLDPADAPAEPVLTALARDVVPRADAAMIADLVEGWEALLDQPLDVTALTVHAEARGGRLFRLAAGLLADGPTDDPRISLAGEGWALADLSRHLSDPGLAASAHRDATERLDRALYGRWPAALRALGAMAHLARIDLAWPDRPAGHPARAARILWHRMTGR